MTIIRDEGRIDRLRQIGFWASLLGMGVLIGGLILGFITEETQALVVQLLAIPAGWLISQVGIYLSHRYVRDPRPDQILDQALSKVVQDGRMYHYVLPASHVLLTRAGVIVFNAKYQVGHVTYEEGKWRQRGVGVVRRIFGQEGLGNPIAEAERDMSKMANFIRKKAPEVEEVPMAAMIVFTTEKGGQINARKAPIPTVHYTKLPGLFKQKSQGPPIPAEDYAALRKAFDEKAGDLLKEEG